MTRHFATGRELVVALIALERFLSRMDVDVVVQLVVVAERLVTVLTLERSIKKKRPQSKTKYYIPGLGWSS